jgi:hypothetical protein
MALMHPTVRLLDAETPAKLAILAKPAQFRHEARASGREVASGVRSKPMLKALRIVLQAVLFFFLLGAVIAIGSPETGLVEKVLLAVLIAGLVWIAVQVRHFGDPHGPRST